MIVPADPKGETGFISEALALLKLKAGKDTVRYNTVKAPPDAVLKVRRFFFKPRPLEFVHLLLGLAVFTSCCVAIPCSWRGIDF